MPTGSPRIHPAPVPVTASIILPTPFAPVLATAPVPVHAPASAHAPIPAPTPAPAPAPAPIPALVPTPELNVGVEAPPELESDDLLQSLGFVINLRGRFLICLGCNKPILPSHASGHSHDQHQMPRFNMTLLNRYISYHRLFTESNQFQDFFFGPSPPSFPLPTLNIAFEGVDIEPAYHCSRCVHATSTLSSIRVHWSRKHSNIPFTQPEVGLGQYIFLSPQFGRWLPVRRRLNSPTADKLFSLCLTAYSHLPIHLPISKQSVAGEPPPWLRKIGWLLWVEKYDMAEVEDFFKSVRTHSLFKPTVDLLTLYVEDAMEGLVKVPPQIRQMLRSITV